MAAKVFPTGEETMHDLLIASLFVTMLLIPCFAAYMGAEASAE
jgi:hypothetical protein